MNAANSPCRVTRYVLSLAMVAVIIMLTLVPSLALAANFPLSPGDTAINNAIDFLRDAQDADGSIGGFAVSAWAVMAIAAAGEDPHEWGSPSIIDYLKVNSGQLDWNKATDLERSILAICAAGEDPTNFGGLNYLAQLKSLYDGEQIGYADTLNDDFWGVLALIAAGESPSSAIIQNTCAFIIDNQNESDGGWSWELYGDSDVDDTAAAIMALAAANALDETVFFMATFFLMYNQNSDGGFPYQVGGVSNSSSDSWAIGALVAAGEDPTGSDWEIYDNPVGHLLSLQNGNGSFSWTADSSDNPEWMTAYAIPALLGDPYPVTPIEWEPLPSDGTDLTVTHVDVPETIYAYVAATVTATIKNIGVEDITDNFTVSLNVDGTAVDSATVNGLGASDSVDIDFTWTPAVARSYDLRVTADPGGDIEESYKGNNESSLVVEVVEQLEGMDFIVSNITVPATICANVATTVTATIANIGDEAIVNSSVIALKVNDIMVDTAALSALDAGDSTLVELEWLPTESGNYTLKVVADSGVAIDESSENNNEYSIQATVSGQPQSDLTVTDIAVPATIYAGLNNTVTATIVNTGGEDISSSFGVELRVNSTTVDSATLTALNAGSTTSVSFDWMPTASGNYTLEVIADSGGAVNESSETNNNSTLEVTIAPSESSSPSAATPVISASIEPGTIDFDELASAETSVQFEITITNSGNIDMVVTADLAGDAREFYADTLKLDDQPWDKFEVTVPPDSSVVISASLSVPQSYEGQIMESGALIFWATAAS